MEFNNNVHAIIPFLGKELWISDTIIYTWVIGAALIIFAIIVRIALNNFKDVPKGFQNFVEIIVEAMDNFTIDNMGKEYAYFGNYFFGVFAFILCSNLSGLIGMRPPTADLATTLSFGIVTFLMINIMGIVKQKGDYFKGYLEPVFLFLPINIISALSTPVSLSFRLFGNLTGGLIIMGLLYNMLPTVLTIAFPSVLHIYFDVFSGCLQAFIFVILSMTFIKDKVPE